MINLRKYLTTIILESNVVQPKRVLKLQYKVQYRAFSGLFNKMGCDFTKVSTRSGSIKSMSDDEYIEEIVCQDSDVKENEMKVYDMRDVGKVLLVRQKGQLSALGTKCSHYGAPLVSSALGDGRLRCQWHGACFNITTGDIEDFPGLDSLPCYRVTVENNNVKVRARVSDLKANKRVKNMAKYDPNNPKQFVVIGGGPSGAACVESLRQEGFTGKITLVARENYLPYDRIKIDKMMDVKMESLQLRDANFYCSNSIETMLNMEATGVDVKEKKITLKGGKTLNYDAVYIATGCYARKPGIPGDDLKNVVTIREYNDVSYIQSQLSSDKHVVVLGSSFIGMESAAYCVDKVAKVTVVSKDSVPFEGPFGKQIGGAVLKLAASKGVNFIPNSGITQCNNDGQGALASVKLANGETLKADICIMGVGGGYNTDFLKNSGITLNSYGAVEVNEYLQTNIPEVFAGGDIANAPVYASNNRKASIGHFGLSKYHGKMAGLNMLEKQRPIQAVPFFWATIFGKGFRYSGHGQYDDIIIDGTPDDLKFAAFYLKNDEVVSICTCGMDPLASQYAELVAQGRKLYREDLQGDALAWSKQK